MILKRIATLILPLALCLLTGCGSGKSRVEGTVTLDGSPVDGGVIAFFPAGTSEQHDAGHAEIKDGKYSVEETKDLKPGNYRVEISWNKPTGKKVPTPGDPDIKMDQVHQVIPAKYNTKSTLSETLTSGTNKKDFDLKSH